jgi:hypothetical protein
MLLLAAVARQQHKHQLCIERIIRKTTITLEDANVGTFKATDSNVQDA